MSLFLALLALAPSAPVASGAPPVGVSVAAPDPARLAAAKRLVDTMMPPDKRQKMLRDMIAPSIANTRQVMERDPELAQLFAGKPELRARFDGFMVRQSDIIMTQLSASLPALMDATAIAYARRFTAAQLDEVASFYRTPTGRSFVDQLPAVMADPAMVAVQREMMTGAMSTLRTDLQSFVGELAIAENGR